MDEMMDRLWKSFDSPEGHYSHTFPKQVSKEFTGGNFYEVMSVLGDMYVTAFSKGWEDYEDVINDVMADLELGKPL